MAKYTDLFLRHEIDLETFAQLSEPDLKEIGVQTFGARKKLACLANSLSKSIYIVLRNKMICSIGFLSCFVSAPSLLRQKAQALRKQILDLSVLFILSISLAKGVNSRHDCVSLFQS